MVGSLLYVETVSTLYTQLWHGETDHLAQHLNLFGRRKESMLLEKVHQGLRSLAKISWLVFAHLIFDIVIFHIALIFKLLTVSFLGYFWLSLCFFLL